MRKKWRFFDATDFQSLMYPCFTFCRILGIFPYKINNSIFEASKLYYIFSIVITSALCVFGLINFYNYNLIKSNINFEVVMISMEANFFSILSSFIAIVTLVLSSSRMRLLQTIMDISSRLSPESYQKLSRLIYSKDIFGFLYVMSQLFVFCYMIENDIFFMIFLIYTVPLIFTMDMLYMNCICILKASFKEINNNLLHMHKFIINNESCVPIMFHYKQGNPFLIMNLKTLKKQHLMISKTIQMLNIIFTLQFLATIIITFSELIFNLYYLLRLILWYNGSIYLSKQVNILLGSTLYYIIKMALLVWACETSKKQAQEIRTTIHDILNSSRDEQIKNELQLFSLQILHCENTFSVKGFNVDATFLTAVVGTVTTYMLILVQFLNISYSCNGKSAIST